MGIILFFGMSTITFIFHNYLDVLLKKKLRSPSPLVHHLERRASIKDVIESFGIPHPVVDRLLVNGREVGFDHILLDDNRVEVFPLLPPVDPCVSTMLRPEPLERIAFIVDVNVGKLALYLRMLGFDTIYGNDLRNGRLAEIASSQKRILLTRDVSLLKRKGIIHGYLLRDQDPRKQLIEVVRLYDLGRLIKPLTRCIACNGLLVPVDKEEIITRLEPLTKKYYNAFQACESCGKIYWPGTHQEKIHVFIEEVLAASRQEQPGTG